MPSRRWHCFYDQGSATAKSHRSDPTWWAFCGSLLAAASLLVLGYTLKTFVVVLDQDRSLHAKDDVRCAQLALGVLGFILLVSIAAIEIHLSLQTEDLQYARPKIPDMVNMHIAVTILAFALILVLAVSLTMCEVVALFTKHFKQRGDSCEEEEEEEVEAGLSRNVPGPATMGKSVNRQVLASPPDAKKVAAALNRKIQQSKPLKSCSLGLSDTHLSVISYTHSAQVHCQVPDSIV